MKRLIVGGLSALIAGFAFVQFATAEKTYEGVAAFAVDRIEIDVDRTSTLKLLQHDTLWSLDMYENGDHVMMVDEFAVSRVGRSMLQLEQVNGPLSMKIDLLSGQASYGNLANRVEVVYPEIRAFDDIADAPTQATVDPRLSAADTLWQRVTDILSI
jgi:hypothetical protein